MNPGLEGEAATSITEMEEVLDSTNLAEEPLADDLFRPPSVLQTPLTQGKTYSYYSDLPSAGPDAISTEECILGVDEAGRGPVLGEEPDH